MSQSSPMATSFGGGGGGDKPVVLEEKKKLWKDVVRKKISLVDRMPNDIPNDIVVEILLRLPAKSLIGFRWTCKYWFDLISRDGSFVKWHLHNSTVHDEIFGIISPSVLSFKSNGDGYETYQCYLNYNNTTRVRDVSKEIRIDTPFEYHLGCGRPQIMGSCNGLILLYEKLSEKLCIWNPCTKEYRDLPSPLSIEGYVNSYVSPCKYGFGYDHTTDDYKVIINTYYNVSKDEESGAPDHLQSDVQVYTLVTNSWRRVGPNLHIFKPSQPEGVYVNGAVYWIDSENKDVISFDIVKEKFQHVSKIPYRSELDNWSFDTKLSILVFEGFPCVVLRFRDRRLSRAEMWVMKDCVVNNSKPLWSKLLTITDLLHDYKLSVKPLRFTNDGEILMVTRLKDLLLHDLKKGNVTTLNRICMDNHYEHEYFIQEVHTESLVSLSTFGNLCRSRTKKKANELEQQATPKCDDGMEENILN